LRFRAPLQQGRASDVRGASIEVVGGRVLQVIIKVFRASLNEGPPDRWWSVAILQVILKAYRGRHSTFARAEGP
jgi:hypothetical protein